MKKDILKELQEQSPMLARLKEKPEGFDVPTDYFAKMEAELWDKVKPIEAPVAAPASGKTSWLDNLIDQVSWLLQPRMALQLASVALVLFVGFFAWNRTAAPATDVLADLTADEASAYILANLDDYDTESLIEASFGDEDFSEIESSFFDEAGVDELLEELLEEDIDLETLEGYL